MIASLTLFVARFVGPKAAKPVLIALAVVAAVLALGVAKCAYDRSIIRAHDTKQEAELATKARPADAKAAEARQATTAIIANDTQEITNALAPLPDAGLTPRQRVRACTVWMRQHPGAAKPAGC
jgi:Tfp pilus assembly protein PilE